MIKSRLAIFAVAVLAVSAYAVQDSVRMVWKPKAGSVAKYRVTSTFEMSGQGGEFGATMTTKISEIKADGKVVAKTTTSDLSLKVAGQDMSSMIPPAPGVTLIMDPMGELVSRTLDEPSEMDSPKMDNALMFIYPKDGLKVGDTWTRKFAANKAKGLPASITTYTFKGVEKADKFDTYKVTVDFKETEGDKPMTATGTYWVRVEDGVLFRAENVMKNVEMGPAGMMDMTNKMILISEG